MKNIAWHNILCFANTIQSFKLNYFPDFVHSSQELVSVHLSQDPSQVHPSQKFLLHKIIFNHADARVWNSAQIKDIKQDFLSMDSSQYHFNILVELYLKPDYAILMVFWVKGIKTESPWIWSQNLSKALFHQSYTVNIFQPSNNWRYRQCFGR